MALIGKLSVLVTASTAKFGKQMGSATKHVDRLSGAISGGRAKLAAWGGALSAIVAGGSLTYLVKQSFETVDALAKTADRLGIATDRLAGLRHAANQTGVATNTLDMALQRMVRRVAEASNGAGEAVSALKELRLDATTLARMSPDQQFATIADALQQVERQSVRVRLAFKLFDSGGVALLNTLKMGSAGLAQMQAEAERLGIAVDRQAAAKIEMANDAFDRLQKLCQGIAITIAVELAPFVEALSTRLVEMGTSGEGMASRVSSGIEWISTKVAELADWVALVKSFWHAFVVLAKSGGFVIAKAVQMMIEPLILLAEAVESIVGIDLGTANLRAFFDEFERELKSGIAEAAASRDKAWDQFWNSRASRGVQQTFDKIRAEADQAARKIAQQTSGTMNAAMAGPTSPASPGTFSQIVRAQTAIGGVTASRRAQEVRDPQLAMTNELLRQMLYGGSPARAA